MESYLYFLHKNAVKLTFLTYFCGMAVAVLLFLILNINFGELTFNNSIGNFLDIFMHNLKVQFFLFLGAILLGIPTIILLFINGFSIGMIIAQAYTSDQLKELLFHIMSHGIFEIPGFLIIAILSYQALAIFNKGDILKHFIAFVKQKKILFLLSFVLTFVAAIIEGLK
ncbi:stage II sporulation protein M [Bacillus mycoides]|uniref:stage II sporulation protein M n=1 Tax=Bacillus mycoides TaxID=1405 RepID=UPI0021134521|nr:stage II sporulation protein M [Bacillus mycoides]MCQ6527839.1 stage II sporulation protein M [Bacillus mycoides]